MDNYSESPRDLSRLRLKIKQLGEEWQEIYEEWDDLGNIQSVEDDLIPLIISTHAAIEDITTHLILTYVITDEFSEGAFDYIYSGMSQSHREELLVKCGILSNKTRGRLSNFKGLRNNVAHGTFQQLDWYRDDVPEKMNTAFDILNSFEDAFTDMEVIESLYKGEEAL